MLNMLEAMEPATIDTSRTRLKPCEAAKRGCMDGLEDKGCRFRSPGPEAEALYQKAAERIAASDRLYRLTENGGQ